VTSELDARARGILNRRPAVGLAVGVVRDGRLEDFAGHGLADIASGAPVTEDTVFRIASVTKTFTAIAVLQLWELGLLDLDAPANRYLRAYHLIPAKASFRPATVRHLLTHTAGSVRSSTPGTCSGCATWARRCPSAAPRRPWPSATAAASASTPSRAPGSPTPTMGSPPSASSSRT
jgi:CubicO group peptidase (beta-lactamase class C family)